MIGCALTLSAALLSFAAGAATLPTDSADAPPPGDATPAEPLAGEPPPPATPPPDDAAPLPTPPHVPDRNVRHRLYVGTLVGLAPIAEEEDETELGADVELVIGEALTARLVDQAGWSLELRAAGRLDVRFTEEETRLDDPRVRALGLRLKAGRVQLDLGRSSPQGGVWRLVDGAQVLVHTGRGFYVGAWGGASPDPWSTLPAPRYGGGPLLGWRGERGEFAALGEVLATADGLDRASGVASGRVELGRLAELSALLDLQTGGADAPLVLSDATVRARLDPREDLRLDLVYDAWSSWSYLLSTARDPTLTRFSARSRAALDDPWVPQDSYDPTVYHMAGATLSWRPLLRRPEGVVLGLDLTGRYRHHEDPLRRHARTGLRVSLAGLAHGRLDVSLGQAFLWWSDEPATETTASLWASLDRDARIAIDSSATVIVQPHDGGAGSWGPTVYTDLFLDALVGRGVTLALGYGLSDSQDLDRWDVWHSVMGRVGWTFDSARQRRREDP